MGRKAINQSQPLIGARFDVAGRGLALHRSGQGGPAVVFCPGAGLIGLDFLNIHEAIFSFTTSVIYDRAGTGWSDAAPLPRTAAQVADELRALLAVAKVDPPFLLVGHSLGGAYARRFAQRYPAETAGLILLDPADEGYAEIPPQSAWAQLRQILKLIPALANIKAFYRPMFARMLAAWPQGLRDKLADYHAAHWRRSLDEARNLQPQVLNEVRDGGALPDVPMIVLTATGLDPFMAVMATPAYQRDLIARKTRFYDALAASVPRGENRLIPNAGHSTLHTDRPDAVVQAIRDAAHAAQPVRAAHAAV
jgi:pimeloyl-ACP methyl ester carboxylesterase